MCLEVAFITSKSLRQSDGLRDTVPNRPSSNRKRSVCELDSCPWNSEDYAL